MADQPEGSPEIPDLVKKAQDKAAGFTWAPGTAKSAASVTLAPAKPEPTMLERLNSTPGRLAALMVVMLLVAGGLSLSAFHDGGASGGEGLGAIKSTMQIRAFKGVGRGSVVPMRDDSVKDRMAVTRGAPGAVNPITGLPEGAAEAPPPGGADGGAQPMNYDAGGTGRAVGSAGAAAGGPGANGAGGQEDAAGGGGFVAPKLNTSASGVKFQGMRRVSPTSGFRSITGGRGLPSKVIRGQATGANSADAASGGGSKPRGSAVTTGGTDGARPAGAGSAHAANTGDGSGGGSGGGGGGGGGTGEVSDPGLDADQVKQQVAALSNQAADLRKDAGKEEQNAKILAAQGQWPQAHYHYDQAEKKKSEADDKDKQAQQLMLDMQNRLQTLTTPPP